jgi:hypothetical protein
MPGLVPGIHGVPLQRTSLLNSRVFPQPARLVPHRLRRPARHDTVDPGCDCERSEAISLRRCPPRTRLLRRLRLLAMTAIFGVVFT